MNTPDRIRLKSDPGFFSGYLVTEIDVMVKRFLHTIEHLLDEHSRLFWRLLKLRVITCSLVAFYNPPFDGRSDDVLQIDSHEVS